MNPDDLDDLRDKIALLQNEIENFLIAKETDTRVISAALTRILVICVIGTAMNERAIEMFFDTLESECLNLYRLINDKK